jgi:hypothetical protein
MGMALLIRPGPDLTALLPVTFADDGYFPEGLVILQVWPLDRLTEWAGLWQRTTCLPVFVLR